MTNAPERGTPQYDEVVAILAAKARALHAHEYAEQQRNHLRSEGYGLDCVCGGCTVCIVRPYIDLVDPPQPAVGHRPPCTDGDYCGEPAHCPPAARQTTGQDATGQRRTDATVDPAMCPRCKGDNQEAFELCAGCATGQDDTGEGPDPCSACPTFPCRQCVAPDGSHPDTAGQPDPAVVERFIQHMATQHPAVAHCCTNCDGIDPDSCLTHPRTAPAVGQPAEAHDTETRERLRLAIAQQYLADTGSGRTVDDLDDAEFGSLADAALSALNVEDETR
ncbi:hypothetical protein ACWENA_08385 [Streptomyces sp. NPDC004779]